MNLILYTSPSTLNESPFNTKSNSFILLNKKYPLQRKIPIPGYSHIDNSIRNKRVMSMQSQFSHAYGKITDDYEIAALSGKNHSKR